jgi:NADPH-dependent 7-cyano-7-deazaguanine reductase QueF-like protein
MHIPPYYKKPSWQRFFVGAVCGGIIAYVILIYMYGSMYEALLEENKQLKSRVSDLTVQNEALTKDKEDLTEKTNKALVIENIEIDIDNWEKYKMDRLTVYELEELIKEEINHLIGEKVSIVAESDFLLERAIENKSYKLNDVIYYFNISKMTISETLKLTLEAKLTE